MRAKRTAALISAALVCCSAVLAGAGPAAAETGEYTATDMRQQLDGIPGLTVVSVGEKGGYPYYTLTFTQPVDHRNPAKGAFEQRLTLWHKSTAAPMVLYTGGYTLATSTREITTLLDANQVSVEHRFFGSSRPDQVDWDDLDIWQEATDEHAVVEALKTLYTAKWIGTGASKGGMTQVYHERHYPQDLDAVVAYVAPDDAVNKDDQTYEKFFDSVGTPECRVALNAVQREMLVRRGALLPRFEANAVQKGYTFHHLGSVDRAYEFSVLDQVWNFWQSGTADNCATVPDARSATDEELWTWSLGHGLSVYHDGSGSPSGVGPYYRQAATQLGWADLKFTHLRDVRRYPGLYQPNSLLPAELRGAYDNGATRDVDHWVRTRGERMMFVYGQNDPWSAEKFKPSKHDSQLYVAPNTNHSALVSKLTPGDRAAAEATIRRWAAAE
ncbi:S28 family serine protease [Streptomyces sp. NBC_01353]|uniref:S28 family serine protease n=1 Tax=Streptomyces sp. NBC_01353 TaxID=2903835 RepID=UPI002E3471BF|nr:S28 family serine protease [Streptomyces sp. NBC_01353]